MKREVTVFATGIKAGTLSFLYLSMTIVLSITYKEAFNIPFMTKEALFIIGLVLLIIGVSVNGVAAGKMVEGFKNNQLVTEGPYSVCANPMYASQIFLSVPGIALMIGSWIILTTTFVGFILLKLFIGEEEVYLRERFGQEYEEYRKKVLIKFI